MPSKSFSTTIPDSRYILSTLSNTGKGLEILFWQLVTPDKQGNHL